ncbi:glycosyltransferase [Capnocytophaga sputigena]|uniref:glycosyltransferase n=1 Tax=Capnocytophaga sputigena TaxID=1019 RepID=UPI000BB5847E|nr:glycosyltransferase [Capnocytophaga sputigena]PBN47603.1 glycosyl transferase family 1 [Capnocytophaga sputigena]
MGTKIYFLCPNNNFMSGGVKQIFHQVETLNRNGFEAFVLLQGKSKQKWFESNAPIAYSPYLLRTLKYIVENRKMTPRKLFTLWLLKKKSVTLDEDSILVIPEIYGDKIDQIAPHIKKVIFNQNCYYTFNLYSFEKDYQKTPYHQPNVLATIVASDDALAYMNYTFPNLKTYKMTLGIDTSVFSYADKKQKQICFMPRKLTDDVRQVILILKLRGKLKDWKLVPIDNKTEQEVAEIMKQSTFFLSFNHREGFGLPPVEAMACGCYVVGYHGQGGKEYFKPEFSSLVEGGDIIAYVKKVEELLSTYEKSPETILEKGKKASEFILSHYTMAKEEEDTIKIWNDILDH